MSTGCKLPILSKCGFEYGVHPLSSQGLDTIVKSDFFHASNLDLASTVKRSFLRETPTALPLPSPSISICYVVDGNKTLRPWKTSPIPSRTRVPLAALCDHYIEIADVRVHWFFEEGTASRPRWTGGVGPLRGTLQFISPLHMLDPQGHTGVVRIRPGTSHSAPRPPLTIARCRDSARSLHLDPARPCTVLDTPERCLWKNPSAAR